MKIVFAVLLCIPLIGYAQEERVMLFDAYSLPEIDISDRKTSREFAPDVNVSALSRDTKTIEIRLPDSDRTQELEVKYVQELDRELGEGLFWIAENQNYTITFSLSSIGILGFVTGDGGIYGLSSYGESEYRLRERDLSQFHADQVFTNVTDEAKNRRNRFGLKKPQVGVPVPKTNPPLNAHANVSVLLLYTPEARAAVATDLGFPATNHSPIRTLLNNALLQTNFALGQSELDWVNHVKAAALPMEIGSSWGFEEGDFVNDLLTGMENDSSVLSLRESLGADMVHLVVEELELGPGLPTNGAARSNYFRNDADPNFLDPVFYNARSAVSISSHDTVSEHRDYAHETGHNFGMAHAIGDLDLLAAHGWHNDEAPVTDSRGTFDAVKMHSTIMANAYLNTVDDPMTPQNEELCGSGCPRQARFSNAGTFFADGVSPTGIVGAAENYRVAFETAFGISYFYPDIVYDAGFGTSSCDSPLPQGWDELVNDNGTMGINSSGLNSTSCSMRVSTSGTYLDPKDDVSYLRDRFTPDVGVNVTVENSIHTLYYLDLSNLEETGTLQDQKTKIHNIQCQGTGCPTPGIVQHKLMGVDLQDGFQLNVKFRSKNALGNYGKIGPIEPLLSNQENFIQTYLRIGAFPCTGVALLWVNNSLKYKNTAVCNEDYWSGAWRATYGVIGPTQKWVDKQSGKNIVFDEVKTRRWGCFGVQSRLQQCP